MSAALLCARCRCDLATEQPIPAGLKPRRATVLRYLRAYIAEHGYPPTLAEIAAGCGLHSRSTARYHLTELTIAGLIEVDSRSPRGIRLVAEQPIDIDAPIPYVPALDDIRDAHDYPGFGG